MENGQLRATVVVDSWAMVQGRMGRLLMGSAGARCWPLDRDDGGDERMVQKGWCARDGSGMLPALEELLAQGAVDGGGARRLDQAARGRTATKMGHDLTIFGVATLLPTFWTAPIS
ncbi:hypothetical protein ACLOJK_001902 [Asimina triloba]